MKFSIYPFQLKISSLIIACVVLLSLPVNVGMANEVRYNLKVVMAKKVWVKDNTPVAKRHFAMEYKVHSTIKDVITSYKTGLNDREKGKISKFILKHSKIHGYDPLFLTALIITESSFNLRAKSKAGALGLMQIRPRTGKALATEANMQWQGKNTLYHPENNIALGSFYLSKLNKRFGNMKTALEAYNHGPTRTARHLRNGKKTKIYSGKVFAIYNRIRLAKADL